MKDTVPRQKWNHFSKTGRPEDYMAYREEEKRQSGETESSGPRRPLL
ncbi:MAG: hypothetical protein VB049_04065 [Candidatus Pelethousia sp.]|nr:hypothetical protein [Candidatus Pelethousia sp.]